LIGPGGWSVYRFALVSNSLCLYAARMVFSVSALLPCAALSWGTQCALYAALAAMGVSWAVPDAGPWDLFAPSRLVYP
jgi:hypothetical protein